MSMWRAVPWAAGVVLVVSMVAAASKLTRDDTAPPAAAPPAGPGGTVVLGTVDSDPPPVKVGPPGIGLSATVTKVFVRDGDTVAPDAPLVQFDDQVFRAKKAQAEAELAAGQADKNKAEAAVKVQAINLARQRESITQAAADLRDAEELLRIGREQFEAVLAAERKFDPARPLTDAEKQKRRDENLELKTGEFRVNGLRAKLTDERKKLDALELNPVDADVKRADAQIAGSRAKILEAQAYIDLCTVKVATALGGGTKLAVAVEQVVAAPGMTFGPSTREPLLKLIPVGPRVVRADVEAEFAARIADKVGQKVTITDGNRTSLTYDGVIRRMGTAFLPKRSAADILTIAPAQVLECLIDVPDPTPPGKPPLRVGQPVRVIVP